jgi:hypothetical protein
MGISRKAEPLLGQAAELVEQGFLAAGESLERADGILKRLTDRFAAHVAELTEGTLEKAGSGLGAAGAQVTQLAAAHASDCATLESLAAIVARLRRRVAGLQPVTREVEVLAVTARVVAGGMGTAGAEFLFFSASIQKAAAHAEVDLKRLHEGIGRLERDLGAARTQAERFAGRHGQAMQDIPRRLASNLQDMADRRTIAGNAATRARARSEAMSQQVAEQISALQLGDIAHQRLQHVRDALAGNDPPGDRPVLIRAMVTAQLEDTAAELERGGQEIVAGLAGLARMATEIGRLGTEVHAASQGQGGFVGAIETELRQTARLFAELHQADADTDRCMGLVLAAAGDLASNLAALQSVDEDIRIMGLNATLKCGRLGTSGRPLSAVAQELRACSARFAAEAAAALDDLHRLRGIASELRDPAREAKHAALAEATESMLTALRRLDTLEAELGAALAGLHEDAKEVTGLLDAAVSQFSPLQGVAETIREVAVELAPAASETVPAEPAPSDRSLLDAIAASYTMAREREVHARFAPLPEACESAGDMADVLF